MRNNKILAIAITYIDHEVKIETHKFLTEPATLWSQDHLEIDGYLRRISGSHGSGYEELCLLGYNAV
jgi:hypothetical protein